MLLTQFGKMRNSLPRKFSVKSIYSCSLIKRYFDGIFAKKTVAVKLRNFHSVHIVNNFTTILIFVEAGIKWGRVSHDPFFYGAFVLVTYCFIAEGRKKASTFRKIYARRYSF